MYLLNFIIFNFHFIIYLNLLWKSSWWVCTTKGNNKKSISTITSFCYPISTNTRKVFWKFSRIYLYLLYFQPPHSCNWIRSILYSLKFVSLRFEFPTSTKVASTCEPVVFLVACTVYVSWMKGNNRVIAATPLSVSVLVLNN